ncbi:hypothetical protein JB92DRAFT_2829846 [Gautieria morchelliformis]|nr:hypothetical protein JB92DRAFT_2829846 [Gautieria morchelliformis]
MADVKEYIINFPEMKLLESQDISKVVLWCEERKMEMWVDFWCLDSGYGGPEAAVAKRLVYRMGMGVGSHMYQKHELWLGRKGIWKICRHVAQHLAPPWINVPRARASTWVGWIRGCWVRVKSVGRWERCDVSCGHVWARVDVGGASGSGRDMEQLQVESHMHICLNTIPEADVIYTVAPSEPALVEVAMQVMHRLLPHGRDPVDDLAHFMSSHLLSKGNCGKFASLFANSHHMTILEAQPPSGGTSPKEAFETFCNFLVCMMARGVAILCAYNQCRVDLILPACYKGKMLTPSNMAPMLIQIQNVSGLSKPEPPLFADVNPTHVGVYEAGSQDLCPVIKLVLSVGTKSASFHCPEYGVTGLSQAAKAVPAVSQGNYEDPSEKFKRKCGECLWHKVA